MVTNLLLCIRECRAGIRFWKQLLAGFCRCLWIIWFVSQVNKVQEEAAGLVAAYAGDKQTDIREREQEVVDAWNNLRLHVQARRDRLLDALDLYKFFAMVLDLTMWMDDILLQMKTQEKPR